ncbi:MAG: hypothetical protein ACYTAF_09615, partial [Planctomycetota bacterium]
MKILAGLFALLLLTAQDPQDAPEPQEPAPEERQQPDPDEQYAQRTAERLQRSLELTDEQTEQIAELLKENRKGQDEKIREILDEAQNEQFQGLSSSGGRRGGRDRGGRGGGGRNPFGGGGRGGMMGMGMDRMKEELGLSDEQVEQIQPILEEFMQDLPARMREAMQDGGGRDAMRQVFEEARDELSGQIKEHLTDEQKEKLDEMFQNPM